MTKILDGRVVQAEIQKKLAAAFSGCRPEPRLAIVQVGERPESTLYVERKKEFAQTVGVAVAHARYPETVAAAELLAAIKNLNQDKAVHGIIVQIPLPGSLSTATILNAVDRRKDIDGLSALNLQALWQNDATGFRPATARGVMKLLDYYQIPLAGREVAVVGRSALVGKPIALACLNAGATVTISHRQTRDLVAVTKRADILIVAAGAPGLITKNHVREGQVVVDVGINVVSGPKLLEEVGGRKLVGDVAFAEVAPLVAAISPVPGGVGPLTIACLFENLLEAYNN